MAVAFDAVGPGSTGLNDATTPNATWAHVNSAAGNAIVVDSTWLTTGTSDITAVDYGGVALARIGQRPSGAGTVGGIDVWGKIGGLPTGSNTVTVTFSRAESHNLGSRSYTGAGSFGTAVSADSNGASVTSIASPSITSTSGGMLAAAACQGNATAGTWSVTGGTLRWSRNTSGGSGSDNAGAGDKASPGGSTTVTIATTAGADFMAIVAVEILPPASGVSGSHQGLSTRQPRRYPSRGVWRGYTARTANLAGGRVQPVPTRQPRRASARAVWYGTRAVTTNLPVRVVPNPWARLPRRYPGRGLWRGVQARTTNLPVILPTGGLVRRRMSARAVWAGYTSRTVNQVAVTATNGRVQPLATRLPRRYPSRALVLFAPVRTVNGIITVSGAGQQQPRATIAVPRRYPSRAAWFGTTTRTVNLLAGNQPGSGLVKRRATQRAVIRGFTARTVNFQRGNQPGGVVKRRYPSRAVVLGYVTRTVNQVPSSGKPPRPATVWQRPRSRFTRAFWLGIVSRTTQPAGSAIRGLAAGEPHGYWSAGEPHGYGYAAGEPRVRWSAGDTVDNGIGAGEPHTPWSTGDPHD